MNSGDVMLAFGLAGIALSLLLLCWEYSAWRHFKAANRRGRIEIARPTADNAPETGPEAAKSVTA